MALTKISSNVIANNTIAVGNIADNSVDATKIASNSILTRHIDDNQIGIDQLNVSDGSNGQMLTTNGSGTLSFSTPSSFDADAAQVFNESGAAVDFRIEGDTDQNLFFVDGSADNIGIGTSSPSRQLTVLKSGDHAVIGAVSGTSSLAGMVMGDTDDDDIGHILYDNSNNSMSLRTNASDALTIDSSGNVAIGTGTTSGKFLVTDSSVMDINFIGNPPELNLEDSGSTSGQKRARLTLNDQKLNIQALSDADDAVTLQFITCDLSSGYVGIAETSPSRRLHINGPDGTTNLVEGNSRTALFIDNAGATYINLASSNSANAGMFFSDSDANNRGGVIYEHANDALTFDTAATERLRILSGGGITFNGDTATANALDDYEEGDFTPIFACAGGSAPSSQTGTGQYTKIGDVVHFTGQISWSGSGSGGVNLRIALPFTPISDARGGMAIGLNSGVSYTSGHMLHLIPELNYAVIYVVSSPSDGGSHTHLNFSNLPSSGSQIFSFGGTIHI